MAVVPGVLAWMGEVGPAIIAFVPLLIAACLFGWHEQVTESGSQAAPDRAGVHTAKPRVN
jgi:hypothetical protein